LSINATSTDLVLHEHALARLEKSVASLEEFTCAELVNVSILFLATALGVGALFVPAGQALTVGIVFLVITTSTGVGALFADKICDWISGIGQFHTLMISASEHVYLESLAGIAFANGVYSRTPALSEKQAVDTALRDVSALTRSANVQALYLFCKKLDIKFLPELDETEAANAARRLRRGVITQDDIDNFRCKKWRNWLKDKLLTIFTNRRYGMNPISKTPYQKIQDLLKEKLLELNANVIEVLNNQATQKLELIKLYVAEAKKTAKLTATLADLQQKIAARNRIIAPTFAQMTATATSVREFQTLVAANQHNTKGKTVLDPIIPPIRRVHFQDPMTTKNVNRRPSGAW